VAKRSNLPVDRLLSDIVGSLERCPNLVIEAPPGAGKTTRVPPALLSLTRDEIVVLEPRRIAARMAARRVAEEMGEQLGETVGYQVRFEEAAGPRTRLRFCTEGILTRRLVSDARLTGVGIVVLDEFHERHLETDLALALLRRLQSNARPDLKLVVMSATMDAAPVARFLDGCPVLRSEGRLFDLTITHTPYSAAPLEQQVAQAVENLLDGNGVSDILAFLPGAAEIRRAARACEHLAARHQLLVLPLHGDLSAVEQDRAVNPASQRKLILSTNVAESSLTIDGVTAVIDSGFARVASDSPWTGLPTLQVRRISKASATQRAGRAARTAPGRVIRLYTQEDFQRRADHDAPEITRRELSQLCLDLQAMGVGDPSALEWLDAPPQPSVAAAEALLDRLGARGEAAKRMARLPLHPRLAKLVVDAVERGVGEDGCAVAALLSSGARPDSCDLFALLDAEWDGLTKRHYEQIRRLVRPPKQIRLHHEPLLSSILAAFPDRVARRREANQLLLAGGGSAVLASETRAEFLVALDIEDRPEKGAPLVRLFSRIEPEWLIDLFPDRIEERSEAEWNRTAERVEAVAALVYGGLVIQESRSGAVDSGKAAQLLAQRALDAGIERFVNAAELNEFLARARFASQFGAIQQPDLAVALGQLCQGLKSFAELKTAASGLISMLEQQIGARRLEEIAPARIRLPGGRWTRVHYEDGKPPWIASRLQDFFGMRETPRVARGQVPVVVHLLAPNQRPVQTTSDLAGFWQRLYPQVRRELGRRYPKHKWPEDPYAVAG
jgi:ATP-dependent helicase HrpB